MDTIYQESESAFLVSPGKIVPGEGREWEKDELFQENAGLKPWWTACSWSCRAKKSRTICKKTGEFIQVFIWCGACDDISVISVTWEILSGTIFLLFTRNGVVTGVVV